MKVCNILTLMKYIFLGIPEEGESKRQIREKKKEEERMEGIRKKTLKKHKSKHKGIGYFCNQCDYQRLQNPAGVESNHFILTGMEWPISFWSE